jgi:hypothetical protein
LRTCSRSKARKLASFEAGKGAAEAGLSARATTNPSAVCPSLVSIWRSTRGWTHKSVQRIAVAMEGDLVHHAQASAQMQGVEILEGKL